MLHVVSGDAASSRISSLDLGGDVLIWREALADGPVAARPAAPEHLESRASFLASGNGGDVERVRHDLAEQVDTLLAAIDSGRPIVLWFGRDLFCQLNLLALIAGIDLDRVGDGQLDLVIPAETRCLAVDLAEMRADFDRRRPLERSTGRVLAEAWQAFAAGTPSELNRLATSPALPAHARAALDLHRRRFPAVGSGLGADERAVLESLSARPHRFADIAARFAGSHRSLGYGDVQVAAVIGRLRELPEPALAVEKNGVETFALTARGRDALAGGRDLRRDGNDVPRNLGGVELGPDRPDWRWDPGAARVARSA